ncbi:hypothetical protein PIB30_057073 [Stylosanthes scabra]|uniref:3'-5' exonuclease domain-containing protein n=1 Tax=Stylosanthes scabra TaxID=79078 RepID=A0ABU6SJG9_9FABA|nr:hypothetical protein [Stylosanthes scabra]
MFGSSSSSPIYKYGISGASIVSFNSSTSKYTINYDSKEIETTRPTSIPYTSNTSATLQLCIDDKCYIDNLPLSFKNFLMNPKFIFVGIEVGGDISKISYEYGLNCGAHADIRELAKKKWPFQFCRPGLKDLAMDVVGLIMKKPKHVSMSNWEARALSIEQVEYGCIDAYKIDHKLLMDD